MENILVSNTETTATIITGLLGPTGDITPSLQQLLADVTAAEASATASAGTASTAAGTAATAAGTAATAAGTAASKAAEAVTSAETASTAASTSATSAGTAATKAAEAAASATTAATAAGTAAAAATSAGDSATSAATSAGTATTKALEAGASAAQAGSSKDTVAGLLATFRRVLLGSFASDALAESFASTNLIPITDGIMYENTVSDKFRIYTGTAWQDYDSSAQVSQSAAALSAADAGASAGSALASASNAQDAAQVATVQASTAVTQAGVATTQAGVATVKAAQATQGAQDAGVQAQQAAESAAISTTQATAAGAFANTTQVQSNIATTKATEASASEVAAQASAAAALASQTASAGSASTANTSAGAASGSAASALAIYGTAAAQQAAITNAQSAASLAQGYALSASSAIQQDLSGVTAQALHRSPNAVTAMFVYDTSKDSDGGAWTEKCQSTSWYNEALNGKWLGARDSEFQARNANSTTSASLVTGNNSTFESSAGNWFATSGTLLSWDATRKTIGASINAQYTNCGAQLSLPLVAAGKTYRLRCRISYTSTVTSQFRVALAGGPSSFGPASVDAYFATLPVGTGLTIEVDSFVVAPAVSGGTNHHLNLYAATGAGSSVSATYNFDNILLEEVTALTTASGDYYQSTVDGKFYRLWKNLLKYSEQLDNTTAWSGSGGVTVVPNASTAADGTMTADKVASGNGYSSDMYLVQGLTAMSSNAAVFSIEAKAAEYDKLWVGYGNTGNTRAAGIILSLTDGTQVVYTNVGGGTITLLSANNLGNGWWRFTMSVASSNLNRMQFAGTNLTAASPGQPDLQRNAMTGDGASGIFVNKVSLEYGSIATAYEAKTVDGSVTETFRGNKADFPRLAGIVAEAASVTIYDLTEAGRPMWMRFAYATNFSSWCYFNGINVSGLAAQNGTLGVTHTGNGGALSLLKFPSDSVDYYRNNNNYNNWWVANNISSRHTITAPNATNRAIAVLSASNAVAMTVLPDAPVDAVTGLQVPTIAVATAGGVSVIKHNGTVENKVLATATSWSVSFRGRLLLVGGVGPDAWNGSYTWDVIDGIVTNYGRDAIVKLNNNGSGSKTHASNTSLYAIQQNIGVNIVKDAKSYGTRAILARLAPTYNTGHLIGDIRRAYLADVDVGSVSGTELVTNGTFDTDTAGWSALNSATIAAVDGKLRITSQASNYGAAQTVVTTVVGKTYALVLDISGGLNTSVQVSGTTVLASAIRSGTFRISFVATVTNTGITLLANSGVGTYADFDNISVREVVADRSYKAQAATITGTLTKNQVAAASQLVAYSGFSAANYLREPYSADLDFGTGEWSASAWVNVPVELATASWPSLGSELNTGTGFLSWTAQGTGVSVDGVTGAITLTNPSSTTPAYRAMIATVGKTYSVTITVDSVSGGSVRLSHSGGAVIVGDISASGSYTFKFTRVGGDSGLGIRSSSTSLNAVISAISVKEVAGTLTVADRAHSSGASIRVGIANGGFLTATAFDGTTTRTVTTTAAYNTGTMINPIVTYTTDGTLAIRVNGVEVAATRGTPLLSLNSRYNLLTYTEDFANAAWTKTRVSVSADAVLAPNGTNTADKIVEDTQNFDHRVTQSVTLNASSTFSVYAKAAERSWLVLAAGITNGSAFFNLANGTIGTIGAAATATISNEGDGWYKCSITCASTSALQIIISTGNGIDSYVGDGTSGLYIWGASLVPAALSALPYQRVNTATDFNFQAPLTIGNSFAADAPFPGSISLLKLSATVPTSEQSQWMYEQEKQMFRDGAQVTLPDSGSIVDLAYDDATDKWLAVSATNESEWSGLVRTSVTASPAGSYSKISAASGIQLQARTTTNPGVDVTIPPYGLREELVNRSQAAARISRSLVSFDYVGGFTANTTSGSTAITSAAGITYPVSYVGARVSGSGIPADTFVAAVSGTTVYLTKAATATATAVQISFNDFVLPVGYEAKTVLLAGVAQREGATQAFTRLFDGFKETIRFTTAPSNTAFVQIQATRSAQ